MMRAMIYQVPPALPTLLTATAPTATLHGVTLSWQDNSVSETEFSVQRDTVPSFDSPALTSFTVNGSSANTTGFNTLGYGQTVTLFDPTVVIGTNYYYRLLATDDFTPQSPLTAPFQTVPVSSPYTSPVSVTPVRVAPTVTFTGAPATALLGANFVVTASTNSSSLPTITGTAGVCTVGAVSGNAASSSATVTITGSGTCLLTANWAQDAFFNAASATQSTTVTSSLPAAPSGLTARVSGMNPPKVTLNWVDNSANETGFTIQRATNATFTAGLTTFTTAANVITYNDATVVRGTRYYYRVRAFNGSGTSAFSNVVNLVVQIGFVQVASVTPQTTAKSVTVSYPAAQTAGNLNIVAVGWYDTTTSVQSVTDNNGNVYSLAIGPTRGTGTVPNSGLSQSIYYATAKGGAATTVTVTFNVAAPYPDVRILEYNGVTILDRTAGAAGNNATSNSGSATTTAANELIFGANYVLQSTTGPGTGFTSRVITGDSDIAEDRIVTATGSYNATAPLNQGNWVMQMATFK